MTFACLFVMSFVFPKTEQPFPFWISALVLFPAVVMGLAAGVYRHHHNQGLFQGRRSSSAISTRNFPGTRCTRSWHSCMSFQPCANFTRKYIMTKVAIYRLQMRYLLRRLFSLDHAGGGFFDHHATVFQLFGAVRHRPGDRFLLHDCLAVLFHHSVQPPGHPDRHP